MAQARNREINSLNQEIERLQSANVSGEADNSDTEYIKLFNRVFDWDKENPQISYEVFNGLLKEGGVIDDLLYYCQNKTAFHWFELDEKLNDILRVDNLSKLSFWLKWRNSQVQLAQFDFYNRDLRSKWVGLNLSTFNSFSLDIPAQLPESLIKSKDITEINDQIDSLRKSIHSAGELQSAYADMVGARDIAEKTLTDVEGVVHVTSCPLCGSEFNNEEALIQRIQFFGKQLANSLSQITRGVATSVDQLKTRIGEVIISPIDEYYQSLGFSPQLWDSFLSLNREELESQYSFLMRNLSFPEEIVGEEKDIQRQITDKIGVWRRENAKTIPAEFDVMRLRRVYSSYGRFFSSEKDCIEVIEKKRKYLTSFWNTTSSQLVSEMTTRVSSLKAQYNKLNQRVRLIKQTVDKIKEQKNAYLSKMVGQIETLFYIYTGRIMQDNYYGRGCFLKYNQSNSNVLFTSGSPDNEVDAIYKMSSGQLISISVSFMLTVNKLYASQPIIAIDDPLQTIDDLNLWGLMETLRHDFRESTVLLSTHERDFGLLLTNKFSKVGLETEYLDMSQHH